MVRGTEPEWSFSESVVSSDIGSRGRTVTPHANAPSKTSFLKNSENASRDTTQLGLISPSAGCSSCAAKRRKSGWMFSKSPLRSSDATPTTRSFLAEYPQNGNPICRRSWATEMCAGAFHERPDPGLECVADREYRVYTIFS